MEPTSDVFFMVIGATIILLTLLGTIISLLFVYQSRQIRNLNEMKQLRGLHKQEILKTEVMIREQTLKNISQEIHDNIGQILALAKLNLSAVEPGPDHPDKARIDNIMNLIGKSIHELRNFAKILDPKATGQPGLAECIQGDLDLLEKSGAFHTRFDVDGNIWQLESLKQLLVYRITQEAISNIIKHSKATNVQVRLSYSPGQLNLSIRDNGIGFDTSRINGTETGYGAGLKNMESRARSINGDLTVTSSRKNGTCVAMTIPSN